MPASVAEREQLLAELQAEVEQLHVKCSTQGGRTSASIESDRRCKGSGERITKRIAFLIPEGFRKSSFSHDLDCRFSAGGSVKWQNDDPHDGTIVLHIWADAFSYAKASVSNVMAVREN